jgi:hypothetical protein
LALISKGCRNAALFYWASKNWCKRWCKPCCPCFPHLKLSPNNFRHCCNSRYPDAFTQTRSVSHMHPRPRLLPFTLAALLFTATTVTPVSAQEASLSECQSWQDNIEHYAYLRKKGGRSSEMDEWRRLKREYEDKFYDFGCREYGRKIK